jgi:hypothetical protein
MINIIKPDQYTGQLGVLAVSDAVSAEQLL